MLKIAIVALLIALFAGALGMGGVSNFALGVSQFFFSVWGLVVLFCLFMAFLALPITHKWLLTKAGMEPPRSPRTQRDGGSGQGEGLKRMVL